MTRSPSRLTGTKLSLLLFGIAVATFAASYGLNVLLARQLPTETYGNLVFAFRVLGTVAALSLLGTGTSSTRFLARYLTCQEDENVESFLRWNTRLIRWPLIASFAIGVSTCLAMFCSDILGFRNIESYHLAVFMLWIAPLFSVVSLLAAYLLCTDHPVVSTVSSQFTLLTVQLALFVLVLFVLQFPSTELVITSVLATSAAVAILVQLVFLHRATPLRMTRLWPKRGERRIETSSTWLSVSLWLIVGQLIVQAGKLLDVSFLEIAPGEEKQLGYYGAALSITSLLFIVPRATLAPLSSRVSSLLDSPETLGNLEAELGRLVRINAALVIGLGAPIAWFSQELLSSFGSGYESAQAVLFISVATAFVAGLGSAAITVVSRAGMEKKLLGIYAADLATLLILGAISVGPYGMTGIAAAIFCAASVRTALAAACVRKRYGIKPLGFI